MHVEYVVGIGAVFHLFCVVVVTVVIVVTLVSARLCRGWFLIEVVIVPVGPWLVEVFLVAQFNYLVLLCRCATGGHGEYLLGIFPTTILKIRELASVWGYGLFGTETLGTVTPSNAFRIVCNHAAEILYQSSVSFRRDKRKYLGVFFLCGQVFIVKRSS